MDIRIRDFRAGLHPELAPQHAPDGSCVRASNVMFSRQTLRTRPRRQVTDNLLGGARTLLEYARHDALPQVRFVATIRDSVYATTTANQTFAGALQLNTRVSQKFPVRMLALHHNLYFVDGESPVKRWPGGTEISGVFQDGGDGPGPTIKEGSIYTETTTATYTITITTAGPRKDVDNTNYAKFSWHQDGGSNGSSTNVAVEEFVTLNDGVTLEWPRTSFQKGDVFKFRCTQATWVESLVDQPSPSRPADATSVTAPAFLAQTKQGNTLGVGPDTAWKAKGTVHLLDDATSFNGETVDFSTGDDVKDVCLRLFTSTDHYKTEKQAIGIEWLMNTTLDTPKAWSWIKWKPTKSIDLSRADSVSLTFKLVANTGSQEGMGDSRFFLELGTSSGLQALTHIVEVPLDGMSANAWNTAVIPLTNIKPEDRSAITHLALATYLSVSYPVLRFDTVTADGGNGFSHNTYGMDDGLDCAVVLLLDSMVSEDLNTLLSPDDYTFCYTYGLYDGVTRVEGLPSPDVSVTISDETTSSITLIAKRDPGVTFTDNDAIYLYAKGGPMRSFTRIGEIRITDSTTTEEEFSFSWDGSIPEGAEGLDVYINTPPKGCVALCTHQGRVLYLKDDWLYISNYNHPGRVPQKVIVEMYDTFGGKMRIGEDGQSLTACGNLQSYTILFKRAGMWAFTGEKPPFKLTLIDAEHGCESHDTVCATGEGVLMWLDTSGSVCAWDGSTIHEVGETVEGAGCPVTPLIQTYPPAQRQRAFAGYDAATRRYYLVIPAGVGGASAGALFIYDVSTGSWLPDTHAPTGAICIASLASTPGVYAVDPSIAKVFRLHSRVTGTSDEEVLPWEWVSASLFEPTIQYKDIAEVIVTCTPSAQGTLTISLYVNERDTAATSITLDSIPELGVVRWRPKHIPDVTSARVGISGMSISDIEILEIFVRVLEKGPLT